MITSVRILRNTNITFTNFRTGKYFARIVYDQNKNGIWDTGNCKSGTQPEKIWFVPGELPIKAKLGGGRSGKNT